MAASDCDGSQRAGLPTSTMMAANAGFPSGQWQPASWLPLPVVSQSLCVAIDTHDPLRELRAQLANRTLACISRTRTISAEGCAHSPQIALSPAFSRTRHARSPQRVARTASKSHSRLISRTRHALLSVQCEVLCVGLCVCFYVCVCV